MPQEDAEFNDLRSGSAVADLTGRRHGRIVSVIGKGWFKIRWDDEEDETLHRSVILVRYTTESGRFMPPLPE